MERLRNDFKYMKEVNDALMNTKFNNSINALGIKSIHPFFHGIYEEWVGRSELEENIESSIVHLKSLLHEVAKDLIPINRILTIFNLATTEGNLLSVTGTLPQLLKKGPGTLTAEGRNLLNSLIDSVKAEYNSIEQVLVALNGEELVNYLVKIEFFGIASRASFLDQLLIILMQLEFPGASLCICNYFKTIAQIILKSLRQEVDRITSSSDEHDIKTVINAARALKIDDGVTLQQILI